MKKIMMLIIAIAVMSMGYNTYAVSLSPQMSTLITLLNQKGVKVYKHALLETTQPSRIQLSNTGIQHMNTGANYWIDKIPYEQDKNATGYIVIPRIGVVSPIIDIPSVSSDFAEVNRGLSIDFNSYLQRGSVHFPSAGLGEYGNTVIAGHSSYWKKDIGRYKNIFFSLPLLEFGDQIWIYKKNEKGSYDRYIYMVDKSYQTNPSDVSVLKQTTNRTLTLFTCTPIGTSLNRRVVTAKYINPPKKFILPVKK